MSGYLSQEYIKNQQTYYHEDINNTNRIASPGSQYIIQLLKGRYLGDYSNVSGMRVLDVGCGSGFNLVSFSMMGWETYGCEISQDIASFAHGNVKKYGYGAEVVVGENQNIPYPDGYFDLLLSSNVIHYANSEKKISRSIKEYARVLRAGGRVLVMTTHPENWILHNSYKLDDHLYRINCPSDFRNEELFFVFQDQKDLESYFETFFVEIMSGENQTYLFSKCLKNFVLTGLKKSNKAS